MVTSAPVSQRPGDDPARRCRAEISTGGHYACGARQGPAALRCGIGRAQVGCHAGSAGIALRQPIVSNPAGM